MEHINLGLKIKELRRERKLTQEGLAQALGVTAQAVSKWEMDLTYPDMTLIPVIANYFEISLDDLFAFDPAAKKEKIKTIVEQAGQLLCNDTKAAIAKLQAALIEYPDDETLLCNLVQCYEFDLRTHGCLDAVEHMLVISKRLMNSKEPEVCVTAKVNRAAALLAMDNYDEAKATLEMLPDHCRDDMMRMYLKGMDKLVAAVHGECIYLESLYSALSHEGEAAYELGKYDRAERCFRTVPALIELFTYDKAEGKCHYWWEGMQTFHSFACLGLAATLRKVGKEEEAEQATAKAYHIISTSWPDFEERREYYMMPFEAYAKRFEDKAD